MCVDVGTTNVEAWIFSPDGSRLMERLSQANPQRVYGADVISRLTRAMEGGSESLRTSISSCLEKMLSGFDVKRAVVTGNTAMLTLLTGRSVKGLCTAPFTLEHDFGEYSGGAYLPKCVSPFIGADALCSILSSGLLLHENALLIDVGTNSEIVLKRGDTLLCASAAAGPCFEGAGIKMGMPYARGAICFVFFGAGGFGYRTVGAAEAIGICASGVIDAVSAMLTADIIDETGALYAPFKIADSSVTVYGEDVRAVQLAKSAIRSAIDALCPDASLPDRIFVSGGFGTGINEASAINIGLFPREFSGKIEFCGNTALSGAAMLLFESGAIAKSEEIAAKCKTLELTSDENFARAFIKNMNFTRGR